MKIEPGTIVVAKKDFVKRMGKICLNVKLHSRAIIVLCGPTYLVQLLDSENIDETLILSFDSKELLGEYFDVSTNLITNPMYVNWTSSIEHSHSIHTGVTKHTLYYNHENVGYFVTIQNSESILMIENPLSPAVAALGLMVDDLTSHLISKGYEFAIKGENLRYMSAIIIGQYITRGLNQGAISINDYAESCMRIHHSKNAEIVNATEMFETQALPS